MPDEEIDQPQERAEAPPDDEPAVVARRRYFTRRNALLAAVAVSLAAILLALLVGVGYRYGYFDRYVKEQFVAKMADIGIVFDAEVFRVTVNPLQLELRNATFNDRVTGERLFFIRDARLHLSIQDLYAWQLSRDITLDHTEVHGAEVWVRFDEEGRSNFSNLRLLEDEPGARVNFKYESGTFLIQDSTIHFKDLSRKLAGQANNVVFELSPENAGVPDDQLRYRFDLTSTASTFTYDVNTVERIDIRASGVAHQQGAEITSFELRSPVAETSMSGTLVDWASPRYEFDVTSTVDLTQASGVFAGGTTITGVGNFRGRISGHGETYRVEGEADSQSLRANGIALRGANIAATVEGTNDTYEANGTAIAEMLTFDEFRIDFLKMSGNVMGTGTDFTWLGELQAAAARSPSLSLGGLYLSDARAEYRDEQLRLQMGTARAQRFSVADLQFTELLARNMAIDERNGITRVAAPNVQAGSLRSEDYALAGVSGRDLRVDSSGGRTDVRIRGVRSASGQIDEARLRNISADELRVTDRPRTTDVVARNLRADELKAEGTRIAGLESPEVVIAVSGEQTIISADGLRVARVNTNAAVLGSINIAGVRLAIRDGRIEGRSNDFAAGDVTLARSATLREGGTMNDVRVARPVFVLEPSGRYRVTADMSLGGGVLGSISLGAARARVEASNDRVALNDLTADIMNGSLSGQATIAMSNRGTSVLRGEFRDLDIAKLLALQGGRITPIDGRTTGTADLTFTGTSLRNASGTLNASITANAGTAEKGLVPITGEVRLSATNGLFNVDTANLNTANSTLTGSGRFDLRQENSDLTIALRSSDASEIDRIIRVMGLSPTFEQQMDDLQVRLGGQLTFDARVTGNLYDPIVEGRADLASLALRGRELGSVSTDISVLPTGIELRNGRVREVTGGEIAFAVSMPYGGVNNTSVNATLTNVNAGNLLAALPIDLPASIRDLNGRTSGTVNITGLPNNAQGEVDLSAANGTVAGQNFDNLKLRAIFSGTLVRLEQADINFGTGRLAAAGTYDRASEFFDMRVTGDNVPAALIAGLVPNSTSIPAVAGIFDFNATATGTLSRTSSYNVNFSGSSPDVRLGENELGEVTFSGRTVDQVLTGTLSASLNGNPQVINATVNLADPDLPFTATTEFNNSPLAPFIALVPQLQGMPITGTGTGVIRFGGDLSQLDPAGNRVFSGSGLSGSAEFSQLALQIQDTPLAAAEPVVVRFNTREIVFERARFTGGGSNMTISGTKALADDAMNNLSIDGRVNLNLLNLAVADTFFSGYADTSIRLSGPNATARLVGTANIVNGSVATFMGSDRISIDRLQARLVFTTDQVEIPEATGYLGGGKFTASGGGTLSGLTVRAFRVSLDGRNVTVPVPRDFVTTGDARLEITGVRRNVADPLQLTVSGRVQARRSLYTRDIDIASIVAGRNDPVLSGGGGGRGGGMSTRFDIVIEGRDALVVRNNIADLTASVSLVITGDADDPRVTGRITANSGTIFFRRDRYQVQRAVLEFPPDTAFEPIINLQAETEIAGYQIFVNLSGPLTDTELLNATLRSSPALPQADVVSLITTGNLTNTSGGIPTLAQTGINTAAEIIADAVINEPIRRATDRLFGLNVFEIDPLISGQQLNPGARLTVGRQINNNLRVTYSTNLSQDQNQVLAFEYRVSNRMSLVAQYEQRSLSNVTRNRDNFSFEVRFRKRF